MSRYDGIVLRLLILGILVFTLFYAWVDHSAADSGGKGPAGVANIPPDHPGIILGVYIPPVDPTMGPNRLYYWQEIDKFNQLVGREHPIIHYYSDLTSGFDDYLLGQLRDALDPSPVPYISMDPWGFSLTSIANGSCDEDLRDNAGVVKRFGKPMLIRFAHEFNGTYMPWNGDPQLYINAWRHIHDVFAAEGVTNVQWVWSPNYKSDRPDLPNTDYNLYYPGDEYVDWISVNGFNWGPGQPGWVGFEYLFHDFLVDVTCRYRKPLMVGLTASVDGPGSKTDWILNAYQALEQYPNLRSIVWFNDYAYGDTNNADFRVTITSQYGQQPGPYGDYTTAYSQAIDDPFFLTDFPDYDAIEPYTRICYSISAPDLYLVQTGDSQTVRVEFDHAPIFNDPVSLDIVNAPPGITYDSNPIYPGATYGEIEVHVASSVTPGSYDLMIQAEGGGLQQFEEFTLAVATNLYHNHLPIAVKNY